MAYPRGGAQTPGILSDYQAYWNNNTDFAPGSSMNIWGGTLAKGNDGSYATYTGPQGQTSNLYPHWGMQDLATFANNNPAFEGAAYQQYGNNVFSGYTPSPGSAAGGINIPSVNQMKGPQSTSGIDPAYKPNLTQWMQQLTGMLNPQAYQGYMNQAYNPAIGEIRQAWQGAEEGLADLYDSALKQRLQRGLNSLAGRGMIGEGTPISETLANEASLARDAILDRQQQIGMAGAGALSNALAQRAASMTALPSTLAGLAGLTQQSQSSNDTAIYSALAQLLPVMLANMQPVGATAPQAIAPTTVTNSMGRGGTNATTDWRG